MRVVQEFPKYPNIGSNLDAEHDVRIASEFRYVDKPKRLISIIAITPSSNYRKCFLFYESCKKKNKNGLESAAYETESLLVQCLYTIKSN